MPFPHIPHHTTGQEKQHNTRNHRFALQQSDIHYDMRKFSLQ